MFAVSFCQLFPGNFVAWLVIEKVFVMESARQLLKQALSSFVIFPHHIWFETDGHASYPHVVGPCPLFLLGSRLLSEPWYNRLGRLGAPYPQCITRTLFWSFLYGEAMNQQCTTRKLFWSLLCGEAIINIYHKEAVLESCLLRGYVSAVYHKEAVLGSCL